MGSSLAYGTVGLGCELLLVVDVALLTGLRTCTGRERTAGLHRTAHRTVVRNLNLDMLVDLRRFDLTKTWGTGDKEQGACSSASFVLQIIPWLTLEVDKELPQRLADLGGEERRTVP